MSSRGLCRKCYRGGASPVEVADCVACQARDGDILAEVTTQRLNSRRWTEGELSVSGGWFRWRVSGRSSAKGGQRERGWLESARVESARDLSTLIETAAQGTCWQLLEEAIAFMKTVLPTDRYQEADMATKKIKTLGERLVELRESGTGRGEIAKQLGVNQATVLSLERGIAIPRAVTLGRAAVLLECPADELLAQWVPGLR